MLLQRYGKKVELQIVGTHGYIVSVTELVESLCKPRAEASLLGYAEAKPKILKCPNHCFFVLVTEPVDVLLTDGEKGSEFMQRLCNVDHIAP